MGEVAKRHSAPPPEQQAVTMGAMVFADTIAMQQMTAALTRIGDLIEDATDNRRKQDHDRLSQAIEALTRKVEQK